MLRRLIARLLAASTLPADDVAVQLAPTAPGGVRYVLNRYGRIGLW